MDISRAISEPLVSLIEFHNGFNRNIKITFGGLNVLSGHGPATGKGTVAVPTGAEPWGRVTQWRNLDKRVKDAAIFVSEIGITRAASAFEDYLIQANAEFDRAGLAPVAPPPEGCTLFARLGATLGANPEELAPLELMTEFFQVARNCVVHRSNRASPKLLELRQNEDLIAILENWTRRKGKGKWKVDVPDVSKDAIVQWLPRHAILASDAYSLSRVA